MQEVVRYSSIIKSTLISFFNGSFENNAVVIYKENLPRTIGLGENGGLLLCIETFSWVSGIIHIKLETTNSDEIHSPKRTTGSSPQQSIIVMIIDSQ
jgi:hypothetical protein